jgi:hypothetical protein
MIVGAGETAEVAAIADADTGDEETGVGRLRLRRLSRENRERGGPETKTQARKNPGETRRRVLPFCFSSAGWLRRRVLTPLDQRSTRNGRYYSSSAMSNKRRNDQRKMKRRRGINRGALHRNSFADDQVC